MSLKFCRLGALSRVTTAAVLALAFASACSPSTTGTVGASSPAATHASPTPVLSIGPPGAAGCRPTSPAGEFTGEVYGTATGGSVWAWFMAGFPPQAGIENKTVWRLDGPHVSGSPAFALVGPASQAGRLTWGPEEHSSSTWRRPGLEFGTGLLFPASGCWDVHLTLGQLNGDVYVLVS